MIRRSCTIFAFDLEPIITKNCDVFTHSYDFCIVTTRNYDFFLVVMRNCVAVFCNYGSQCDRSYGVTVSQFDRNETHGRNVITLRAKFFALSSYSLNRRASASHTRSIEGNESLPLTPDRCTKVNFGEHDRIEESDHYANNINSHLFNFPLNIPILVKPSHEKYPIERDKIHILQN